MTQRGACLSRVFLCFTGAWLGMLLCIALMAAPAVFGVVGHGELAGRVVARLFAQEAAISLVAAMGLLFWIRREHAHDVGDGEPPAPRIGSDARLWLALGTIFCTVAGYYALQPLMEAARAGQGVLSFGALHGVSVGFFGVKGLLVLGLLWRLTV